MTTISKLLHEALTKSSDVEEMILSINSFSEITDDMVPFIVSSFGYDGWGWNEDKDAIEDLTEHLRIYRQLPDPVTLYRVVGVKNRRMINTKEMGEHFVLDSREIDDNFLWFIEYESHNDEDAIPYIIEVSAPLSEIDIWETIEHHLCHHEENEITLKNNGKGAKFIKAFKYNN